MGVSGPKGIDRRQILAGGLVLAATPALGAQTSIPPELARFATAFMEEKGAPGMTLALVDAAGVSHTRNFGFADLTARRAITPAERFHIGSITKSFAALMILQLVDEGKIELGADVRAYLPELVLRTPYGPVTVHHLLCHSSGMPGSAPPPGWDGGVVEQGFAPGSAFHYCNLGYAWLGQLIERVDGGSWSESLRRRILDPLDMTETLPTIGAAERPLETPSYVPLRDDRPYLPRGPLTRAGPLTFTAASGCIASTARDMGRYIWMLAHGGRGPRGRLLSEGAFKAMTSAQVQAPEFGPESAYGYGFVVEKLDGRPVIRHTGGMVSFMSSMHVDIGAGVGAFASINAQQGYRPVPVTAYATMLLRPRKPNEASAAPPNLIAPVPYEDYVGDFAHDDGRIARVTAHGKALELTLGGSSTQLISLGDDTFASTDPKWRLFTFRFARAEAPKGGDKPRRVVALQWAKDAYVRPGAVLHGPAAQDVTPLPSEQLASFEGLYVSNNVWSPVVRVVARQGRLWLDGALPLASLGGNRFRVADEPGNPDLVVFSPADGRPRQLALDGVAFERIADPMAER